MRITDVVMCEARSSRICRVQPDEADDMLRQQDMSAQLSRGAFMALTAVKASADATNVTVLDTCPLSSQFRTFHTSNATVRAEVPLPNTFHRPSELEAHELPHLR
jgi:hypothetical protein